MELVDRVAAELDRLAPAGATVAVAVSGGPDSLALLDLLVRGAAQHRRPLVVVHVDHGIHPESGGVAARVAAEAARLGLGHGVRRLGLGATASETVARRARLRALRELAVELGAASVALGHHADDQAETVLLRVLQGSGPAGLAGMAPRRGPWIRPLLAIPSTLLHAHLDHAGLSAWQDPANRDPRHLRSWLRISALPLLETRFPELRSALALVAQQAARNRRAWNQVPALLVGLDLRAEPGAISVAAAPLRGYRSEVQDAVLSALARRMGTSLGRGRREAVRRLVAAPRSGARVPLAPRLEAEVAFGRLVLRRPVGAIAPADLPAIGSLVLARRRLRVSRSRADDRPERGGWRTQLAPGAYQVRSWRPGDRIRPLGGSGSRSVAELFKEGRVAAGERAGWPVIVTAGDDATIVWVPGICRSGGSLPTPGEEALDVECDLA